MNKLLVKAKKEIKTLKKNFFIEHKKRQKVEKYLSECEKLHAQALGGAVAEQKKARKFSQILLVQHEEEKKAISRELHDEIAQMLTGVNFELAILSKEAEGGEKRVREKIVETQKLIVKSVEIIHKFASGLRPLILDDLGLEDALISYIKDFATKSNIPVKLKLKKPSLEALGCFVFPQMFGVPKAHEAFDETGTLKDPKNLENLSKLLQAFIKFI